MVDSAASYAGALLTPVSVFIAVPVALRQLGEADAGKFLVIVSFSRLISGFDLGIAQLATPRLRSFESHSQSRRKFCVSSVLALGCISVIGAALMSLIFSLSSGAILKSVNFHDVIALMCLAFGFSLATFAREFSGAVKQYRSAFVISSTASVIYLSLILKFINGIGPELGLIVAGYLITQSIAILVVSSLKSRDQSAAINGFTPRFSWRTAVTIQAISFGNLATVQVPVVLASFLLSVEDVLQVAVAFQIANAVRLVGSSVSPFILSQMSGLSITEIFRLVSSIRRYWILTLLGGSLVGVLLSTPVDRFFLADGSNNTSYRLSVVWGVVWGATALLPLITTTAFRSLLQLQAEMILAMYSTGSALLLALGMWHTRSMSITLGISLGSILLGVAIAEMLFSHFGKKVRLTSTQENAKL